MAIPRPPNYDVALWQTHVTEDDCDLIIRTNNGRAFYCHIDPSQFHHSPAVTEQYFKCLTALRAVFEGEEETDDDFYMEDACDLLAKHFEPLINELAIGPPPPLSESGRPTLSQYLFAPSFVCSLRASNDVLEAYQLDTQDTGFSVSQLRMGDDYVANLNWTLSYHPANVDLSYDNPQHVLIRRPAQVVVKAPDGSDMVCFFKPVGLQFGHALARKELFIHEKIIKAKLPPDTLICQLYGLVRDGNIVYGMLFPWVDKRGVLCKGLALKSSAELRQRWSDQISQTISCLHQQGIAWGDAKADNVLIDKNDDAWLIDFGGGYTHGWVDKEKAGTVEGDMQGLAKILSDVLG